MSKKLNVIDLFSGCGGFSYGFEQAGFQVILGVDNTKAALDTFEKNHKNSKSLLLDLHEDSSIEKIVKAKGNKNVDVIIAGPPCQGFSLTGTRNEKDDRIFNKKYAPALEESNIRFSLALEISDVFMLRLYFFSVPTFPLVYKGQVETIVKKT